MEQKTRLAVMIVGMPRPHGSTLWLFLSAVVATRSGTRMAEKGFLQLVGRPKTEVERPRVSCDPQACQ